MGGNALKTTNKERLKRDEYKIIEKKVVESVKKIIPHHYIPRYFDDKETFGDLDILYYLDEDKDVAEEIVQILHSKEYVIDQHTLSCEFCSFQIDFIKTDKKYFECNKSFLDFSSFGQILSRMFKSHELKYKQNGLFFNVWLNHDSSKHLDEIYLSNDPQQIFTFIGLDYNQFVNGFKEKKDMFDFLTQCNYFEPNLYLEKSDYIYRQRLKKRPVYQEFVTYIFGKTYANPKKYIELYKNDKDEFRRYVLQYFDKTNEYCFIIVNNENRITIKNKFNGILVENITGLKNKELGIFMDAFKSSCICFEEFIINNNDDVIKKRIAHFFNEYYNANY